MKLLNALRTVWWLCTPQKLRCPLCSEGVHPARLTAHMWLEHADGT